VLCSRELGPPIRVELSMHINWLLIDNADTHAGHFSTKCASTIIQHEITDRVEALYTPVVSSSTGILQVRSDAQVTFPARGILKGSVQNTSFLDRASREELTAIVSSIGSSGGITDVTIMVQFRNSLKRLRSGSCRQHSH